MGWGKGERRVGGPEEEAATHSRPVRRRDSGAIMVYHLEVVTYRLPFDHPSYYTYAVTYAQFGRASLRIYS